jgi:8-oxo-dGTP diphosphatase
MERLYLRVMASVIARKDGRILMQHRAAHKKIAPNLWAIPGGHVEPYELRAPKLTALRELYEETGLTGEQFTDFGLRCVQMSMQGNEIRLHFDYAADVMGEPVLRPNDEGTLHWLEPEAIPKLDMRPSMHALMGHYLANPQDMRVYMGFLREDGYDWLPTNASTEATFRPTAGVIARHGGDLLLLHRAETKELAPGMWANIGGHMEADELHDPEATAKREFYEETGIAPEQVRGWAFRSATLVSARPSEFGLLVNYTGALPRRITPQDNAEDGTFHWVAPRDVEKLPMTPAMRSMALHDARGDPGILLCLVRGEDVQCYRWMEP